MIQEVKAAESKLKSNQGISAPEKSEAPLSNESFSLHPKKEPP